MSTSKTQLAHLADRVSLVADDTNGPEIWKFVTDENNSDFDSWVKATHGEVVSGGPLVISEKTTNTQTISGTLYHFNPDGNNPYPIPPPPPPPKAGTFNQIKNYLHAMIQNQEWVLDYDS